MSRWRAGTAFAALLVLGPTLLVFLPVVGHAFVDIDDGVNVYLNRRYAPPTLEMTLRIWKRPTKKLYIPVTYTAWAAVAAVSIAVTGQPLGPGDDPNAAAFHAFNLACHLASAAVVFALLRLLLSRAARDRERWVDAAAAIGALLFALHPVQVEPVAWVTGLKDLLCGLLSLTTLWAYLGWAARERDGGAAGALALGHPLYGLACLSFVLALLAKPAAAMVPLVAVVLDLAFLQGSARQRLAPLLPWTALAVAAAAATKLMQPDTFIATVTPVASRPLVAGDALAFYLRQLVIPLQLGFDYGRSPAVVLTDTSAWMAWLVPLGVAALLVWPRRGRGRRLACLGVFVAGVSPVLGFVPFDFQDTSTVADRYLYVSMLGPGLGLAMVVTAARRPWVAALACLLVGVLGFLSVLQVRSWKDSDALFTQALAVNPESFLAHTNLGARLADQGHLDAARHHLETAAGLRPEIPKVHHNLGELALRQGRPDDAVGHFRQAARRAPDDVDARLGVARALFAMGRLERALERADEVLAQDATAALAHRLAGQAHERLGRPEAALRHLEEAVRLSPDDAECLALLGQLLVEQGRPARAVKHLRRAVRLDPENELARAALAAARHGRSDAEAEPSQDP